MSSPSPLQRPSYDIIICGGGTAGLVLANRLSAIPSLTVLVLEAGENANDDFRVSTPGLFSLLLDDPERDWKFMGEPSPGMNNRRVAYPRGKCLGGSSAINLMALIFPGRACLDAWETLGNEGWGWEGMERYFRRFLRHSAPTKDVESALGLDEVFNEDSKAMDGPISCAYATEPGMLQTAWVDTWKNLGKQLNGDPLNGDTVGGYASATAVDVAKGRRSHAGVAYWEPVKKRDNLEVLTGALIDRVAFGTKDGDDCVAKGVVFSHGGNTYFANAEKEVILATGTMGSSAILERSGIGSKVLCDELGIENVIDLPGVGENFQDHVMAGISYEVNDDVPTADRMREASVREKAMELYQKSHSGPLSGSGGSSFAYTPLIDFIDPAFTAADMQDLLDKYLPTTNGAEKNPDEAIIRSIYSKPLNASSSLCFLGVQFDGKHSDKPRDVFGLHKPENYVAMLPQLAHPLSRGSIHIKSTDASVYPVIKPTFCAHPLDVEIMARHIVQAETLTRTPPLSGLLKPNGKRIPEDSGNLTLEKAKEIVKAHGTSNYHPAGTCGMRPREMGGVVDSRLKVYGARNLRVCDASIFPLMVRGNIQSTVYAVAEKGSDILKEDLGFEGA